MMGQAHRIKRGKLMNTIGIALISFSIGLIISWKLAERDIKNEKTEEYFHREVFPMINAFAKECRGHAKQKITVKGIFSNEQICSNDGQR